MNQMSKLDAFIQQAVTAMPISGTSLIASLYGDALLQRGGEVWLGSVAALLEGLGFGERFVRTALFRLNKEEWLDVVRIGRRSFYRLSDKGLRLTRRAEHKIYRANAQGNIMPRRGKKRCVLSYWRNWRIRFSSDASYRILISFLLFTLPLSPRTPDNPWVFGR